MSNLNMGKSHLILRTFLHGVAVGVSHVVFLTELRTDL